MSFASRIDAPGPKKLLALDGGGIRGLITIEILLQIEKELKVASGSGEDFVLGDYFDYVAGTSTGAIIAACIASGMSIGEIKTFYTSNGQAMFDKASVFRRLRYKYEDEKLAVQLQKVFRDRLGADPADTTLSENGHPTLGSPKLKTLLMAVLRNASTDSPWPVSNNPHAKYNATDRRDCNLRIPLWQLVRASTAAPVYFPPEVVSLGEHEFVFVDGGITMFNNPAFQLFLMATLEPYHLMWPTGVDRMLLVSVGTGAAADANKDLHPDQMNLIYNIPALPSALMFAALNEQDMLCRVFGQCRHGGVIDFEVGNLCDVPNPIGDKAFAYVRYNAELSDQGLVALGIDGVAPKNVQQMDSTEHMDDLVCVGAAAARAVDLSHFDGFV